MKYVKPIDPVAGHLMQDNPENVAYYASSLINSTKPEDFKENYWFPTPEDLGDPQHHPPVQERILSELTNLQEIENFNLQDELESRKQFLTNFDWKDSMLQPAEIARLEDLLVEFHDIFARHRFDIGMNEDFKVKLTPKEDSPAYSQSLPTPINLKGKHPCGISTTTSLLDNHNTPILQIRKPNICPKET